MLQGMRDRPDYYAHRAKKSGYLARSVYKLEEIQQKFKVIRRSTRVLDVGAAPGSWSQFAASETGPGGLVVAVDQNPLALAEETKGIVTLLLDISSPEAEQQLEEYAPFQTVLSDAAPATTGNRSLDTTRSAALVESVLYLADRFLEEGGNLVAKIFQGGEEQELLKEFRSRFSTGRAFKPKACRPGSFETYLVGLGRKAQ